MPLNFDGSPSLAFLGASNVRQGKVSSGTTAALLKVCMKPDKFISIQCFFRV